MNPTSDVFEKRIAELVRLSVGIEDGGDLIADLDQALGQPVTASEAPAAGKVGAGR